MNTASPKKFPAPANDGHSPQAAEQRCYPADMQALPDLLDSVVTACVAAGLSHNSHLRAQLAIEELFTNSVLHGYGGGQAQPSAAPVTMPVWLMARCIPGELRLTYQDGAPPFNPLSQAKRCCASPLEARPVGGLGVTLIEGLDYAVHYEYKEGRNTLHLVFR